MKVTKILLSWRHYFVIFCCLRALISDLLFSVVYKPWSVTCYFLLFTSPDPWFVIICCLRALIRNLFYTDWSHLNLWLYKLYLIHVVTILTWCQVASFEMWSSSPIKDPFVSVSKKLYPYCLELILLNIVKTKCPVKILLSQYSSKSFF